MDLYFVKATYTGNVYKLSDFYNGTNYRLNENKRLAINFDPDDGLTDVIVPTTTRDGVSIKNYTHIIVPSHSKIYRIASYDFVNTNQFKLTLDEDALIGNYQEFTTAQKHITRSNNMYYSTGINDITPLKLRPTNALHPLTKNIRSGVAWNTGRWALLTIQVPTGTTKFALKFSALRANEAFSSFQAILSKYPQVVTNFPQSFSYFQSIVRVINLYYQCVWDGSKLTWINITGQTDIWFNIGATAGDKLNKSGVSTVNIVLPYERHIYWASLSGNRLLASFDRFEGLNNPNLVYSVKVIDDVWLPFTNYTYEYDSSTNILKKTFQCDVASSAMTYKEEAMTNAADQTILFINDVDSKYDASLVLPHTFDTYEPFKEYTLNIYGEKFKIPRRYIGELMITMSFSNTGIQYLIHDKASIENVLGSGSFSHEVVYQVDQLDLFNSMNPTYKDEFNNKMWQKALNSVQGIAKGAAGGFITGGPAGAVAGGAIAASGTITDMGFSYANEQLRQKGLELMPDQVFGNRSNLFLQSELIYAMYWTVSTSDMEQLMLNEYYLRGFPCNVITNAMPSISGNPIFGNALIFEGKVLTIIKNSYITNQINQKLREGVIFV